MRLVCPNCEAKYEVPDDAIPDTGRDVQCANCGHAWFQMRARPVVAAPEPPPAPPVAQPAVDEPPAKPEVAPPAADPAPEAVVETPAESIAEPEPAPEAPAIVADEAPADASPADAAPSDADADPDLAPEPDVEPEADRPAYAVDESVLAILREEAEREANARRAEARALETQTDLGLDAAPPAPQPATAEEPAADDRPAPRRDLLPDVEEINSTLRPSETGQEDGVDGAASPVPVRSSGGFRGGFLTVMVAAIVAAAVYLAAPQIGSVVPALEGPLQAYVGQIDGLRLALDGLMRSATVAINGG